MRSGRMARRLIATAGMGAIIAMGVLSACARKRRRRNPPRQKNRSRRRPPATPAPAAGADGEVDQPDRRQPVLASGQGARTADAGSRQRTRQQVEHVRACSHVPWRQLTPDWSIGSRSRPPSPHCCAGGRVGRHMADGHVQRRLHEPRVASRLGEQVAAFDRRK